MDMIPLAFPERLIDRPGRHRAFMLGAQGNEVLSDQRLATETRPNEPGPPPPLEDSDWVERGARAVGHVERSRAEEELPTALVSAHIGQIIEPPHFPDGETEVTD